MRFDLGYKTENSSETEISKFLQIRLSVGSYGSMVDKFIKMVDKFVGITCEYIVPEKPRYQNQSFRA